jgi:hypothetical protein
MNIVMTSDKPAVATQESVERVFSNKRTTADLVRPDG